MNTSFRFLPVLALLVLMTGCPDPPESGDKDKGSDQPKAAAKPLTESEKIILGITQSEQLTQSLSGKMKKLAASFRDPGVDLASFAEAKIDYQGIADGSLLEKIEESKADHPDLATYFYWPIAEQESSIDPSQIWGTLINDFRFEDSQIGVLAGDFPNSLDEFVMETKFEGRIAMPEGRKCGVKGKQTLTWREVSQNNWKLVGWKQKELKFFAADHALFSNVTEQAFPDEDLRKRVQRSSHQELIVQRSGETNVELSIKDIKEDYKSFSDWESTGSYPAVSVVDFDNDGHDDLFLTDRWQSAQLLKNNGDDTYTDVTAEAGLDFGDEFVNCGYFFDYDNDGDADLLVGYSVLPSRFWTNEGGKFVPHDKINEMLQDTRMVLSISGADINRDGLLDLYLCTYSAATGPINDWIEYATRPEDRVKTRLKIERADKFVNRGGPPNIMLLNRGDTFEWVEIDDVLKQFRCSYQSSWMDWDNDGDLDLYVCNDFSPDVFLRNDTPQGSFEPKFKDVTKEIAPTVQMGFGMATSYGDFDNDGDLDLYVCNMYSKAGNRIIARLKEVDERLAVGARGNFLYENLGGEFRQIAGDGPDQQHVNVVGWSYGGQFADFDNDGQLDLYVPSGFYSAPKEVNTDLDL